MQSRYLQLHVVSCIMLHDDATHLNFLLLFLKHCMWNNKYSYSNKQINLTFVVIFIFHTPYIVINSITKHQRLCFCVGTRKLFLYFFPTGSFKVWLWKMLKQLVEVTYIHIHNWHYNPSVRIIDLISHTTYVVCVNFTHKWRYLQFKVDSKRQIF